MTALLMLLGALWAALDGFEALNDPAKATQGWALVGLAALLIVCATALTWRHGDDG